MASSSLIHFLGVAPQGMRHRQLSPSASVRVSPLCLGAMTFGEAHAAILGHVSKDTAFSILDHFYSQGGNFIDTANGYQDGGSEIWLGEWMRARDNRDEIVLATKFSGYMGQAEKKHRLRANFGGNSTKSMKVSVAASLRKLQTHYIDILYVHWFDYTTTIPELMHGLNDLVVSGTVLYLGISDTPAWIVSKANQYARDHGLRPFVVYQGMWNAAIRDVEREIIPMCRDEGMALAPYGVLGSGHFKPEAVLRERERTGEEGRTFHPRLAPQKAVAKVLEQLADARECGLTDIALAYVMQKTPYVVPIVGARTLEQIQSSLAALSIALTDEEVRAIEAAYPFDPGFPHTFLSGTLFSADVSPKAAQHPGDIFLLEPMGRFDWVDPPKPIKPAGA